MIEIDITHSEDLEALGPRKFFKNKITIGLNHGDILIRDKEMCDYHLKIEVRKRKEDFEAIVSLNSNITHYHLNSKRTTSASRIKQGDILKVGSTSLLIKDINLENIPTNAKENSKQFSEGVQKIITLLKESIEISKKNSPS